MQPTRFVCFIFHSSFFQFSNVLLYCDWNCGSTLRSSCNSDRFSPFQNPCGVPTVGKFPLATSWYFIDSWKFKIVHVDVMSMGTRLHQVLSFFKYVYSISHKQLQSPLVKDILFNASCLFCIIPAPRILMLSFFLHWVFYSILTFSTNIFLILMVPDVLVDMCTNCPEFRSVLSQPLKKCSAYITDERI